jgi:NitT/TauT family transport system substrate-binding protein
MTRFNLQLFTMHLNEFNNNGDDYHFGIPHRYSTHYLLLEELRKQLKIEPGHFSYHEMSPAEMPAALSVMRLASPLATFHDS